MSRKPYASPFDASMTGRLAAWHDMHFAATLLAKLATNKGDKITTHKGGPTLTASELERIFNAANAEAWRDARTVERIETAIEQSLLLADAEDIAMPDQPKEARAWRHIHGALVQIWLGKPIAKRDTLTYARRIMRQARKERDA